MASVGGTLGLSGLPLTETLAKLRKVEEAPLGALATRKTIMEAQLSAYGVISNALSTFKTAVDTAGKTTTYGTFRATSSDTTALTATAVSGGGAVAGSYTIRVDHLATNQSLSVAGQASRTDAIGTGGKITFTLGDGSTKIVDLADGDTSLEGVRKAINAAGVGVSATLLNSGETSAPHVLSLSTAQTGLDERITGISVSGNAELNDLLAYDEATSGIDPTQVTERAAARNASFSVNGIAITSASNTVEDAIEGLTLNLLVADADKAVTVRVAADNTAATAAVQGLVSAYNTVNNVLRSLTSYNADANEASVLTGDRIPRMVQAYLRDAIGKPVENDGFSSLAQIGVKTNIDTGALELDTEVLNKALRENPDDIAALFVGEKGLAKRLEKTIDQMLDREGLLANAQNGVRASVKDLDEQVERVTLRVETNMARYEAQFVALEKFMSQMNGTSSYLTQQLDMLSSMYKNNK